MTHFLVRLRNAVLIRSGVPKDFDWTPDTKPESFLVDRCDAPPSYQLVAGTALMASLTDQGDWDVALRLSGQLTQHAQDKGAISKSPTATLRAIFKGYGCCSDFTKAYLGLAYAAGLFVREWAFSFDGFGGHGHTFVEVFDRQRGQWAFLDVYNNVHMVDAKTMVPLTAWQVHQFALGYRVRPLIVKSGAGRIGYIYEEKLIQYYHRGAHGWFLWWGNNVFTRERHRMVQAASRVSNTLAQLAAILVGLHPQLVAMVSSRNERQVDRMLKLAVLIYLLSGFFILTFFVLLIIWS